MAQPLQISVDLELNNALQTLGKLEQEFIRTSQKMSKPMAIDLNTGKATDTIGNLSKTFNEVAKSSRQVESEIKNAMASLVASGAKGSTEFEKLSKELEQEITKASIRSNEAKQ